MKNLVLIFLLGKMVLAQISQGGTPPSFLEQFGENYSTVIMPPIDLQQLLIEDELENSKDIPFRFGYPHHVEYSLNNSGTWEYLSDGSRLWRLRVISENAVSLNLTYNDFYLPDGSKFYIYNEGKNILLGAFDKLNNKEDGFFGTGIIQDDTITLEYFEPHFNIGNGRIQIETIVHGYKDVFKEFSFGEDFGSSGSCNINVNCPEGNPWRNEVHAIAMILTHGGSRICSGSLINNVREDLTPYFLTANHCTPNQNINTWVFMFNYQSPTCANANGPTDNTISGASILAKNSASDFALLKLNENPPPNYNVYFSGWDRSETPASSGASIHHPSGDIKKISISIQNFEHDTWNGTPPNSHWRVRWKSDGTSGVTEPGSSGSPIFDQNQRIVGQLHGGPSSCTASDKSDIYGKFSMSWDYGSSNSTRLRDWLDPDNTNVSYLNGKGSFKISQKREDGTVLSSTTFGKWEGGPTFTEYPVPKYFTFEIGDSIRLKGFQSLLSNPSEKYNRWNEFSDVRNHNSFLIDGNFSELVSNFKRTEFNVQIKNSFETSNTSGGLILFADPWLIDYNEPPYGLRNRGNDAFPLPLSSPVDFSLQQFSNYQGVFLDQSGPPLWNPPYYSVKTISPQDIPLQQTGRTHRFYFQNWGGTNVEYEHADQLETGVVFTDENAVASANMKGTQLSNYANAFENSGSKKIVKTDNGYLHCIYESLGKIFYEYSSDNGVTWDFLDYYNPIIGTKPSVEYIRDFVFVSFITPTNNIQVNLYWKETNEQPKFENSILVYEINPAVDISSTPVLGVHRNEIFTIVWKEFNGDNNKLYCRQGYIGYGWNGSFLYWKNPSITKTAIEASSSNSVNPAISALKTNDSRDPRRFYLVWQENSGANSAIKYCEIISDEPITFSACTTLSALSGHPKNYKPSIVTLTNFDTQNPIVSARVCWIGERELYEEERFEKTGSLNKVQYQITEKRVIFTATDYLNHYWNFSGNVTSVQINKFNNMYSTLNRYTIGWGRGNDHPFQYTDNRTLSNLVELSIIGADVQVVNGVAPDVTTMNAFTFNNQNLPYYMRTQQIYNSANKENVLSIASGREGVVQKDSAQFYFTIGDLTLNSAKIEFIEIPQTVEIDSLSKLNKYLVSEPFMVSDNTNLAYSVLYGLVDSASASNVLGGSGYVNFKVELIDAVTNQVIGLYDDITYNATNLFQYNNISYQVNMNGIGNREVKLRLVVDANIDPKYSVSEKYSSDEILPKKRFVEVQYQGKLGVTAYALEQNYPNPFNPVTTINYQIPKSGRVVLKVYDILGKEIATLANEEKEIGRYSVNFDASKLSSGVYLYELVANDYRAVKKLMVIK